MNAQTPDLLNRPGLLPRELPVDAANVAADALQIAPLARRVVDVWIWCLSDGFMCGIGYSADAARTSAVVETILQELGDGSPLEDVAEVVAGIVRTGCAVRVTVPRGSLGVQILAAFTSGTPIGQALRGDL